MDARRGGDDHRRAGGAPIKRAVANLCRALAPRHRKDMDEARLTKWRDSDEAAQKIEL